MHYPARCNLKNENAEMFAINCVTVRKHLFVADVYVSVAFERVRARVWVRWRVHNTCDIVDVDLTKIGVDTRLIGNEI